MSYLLLAICIILIVGLWYALRAALERNRIYESAIARYYKRIDYTLRYMRTLDDRQIFESDDEVGETFKQLLFAIDDLVQYVPDESEQQPDTQDE